MPIIYESFLFAFSSSNGGQELLEKQLCVEETVEQTAITIIAYLVNLDLVYSSGNRQ